MIKVLYIAHYFPPIGGAGVQRTTKFVKYLPSFGIEPLILTGTGTSSNRWTPKEMSLINDLPNDLKVYRCDWESHREQRIEMLIEEGGRIIQEQRPDAIFVTMSPFTDALVAAELAKKFSLPWIADLRDPWALDEVQVYRSRWHRMREKKLMHQMLKTASKIIMNTPESARLFRNNYPDLAHKATESITNGFDADDFQGPEPLKEDDVFRIVHTGYLHTEKGLKLRSSHWLNRLLGRTVPGVDSLTRSHVFLMKALERWLLEEPDVADKVRLILAGVTSPIDRSVVESSPAKKMVEFRNYLPHDESLKLLRSADLLFLPMHTMPAGCRPSIVPGKAYEYMASGRPILAAIPDSDTKDFLTKAGTSSFCEPDNISCILENLKKSFKGRAEAEKKNYVIPEFVMQFERKTLTGRLSKILLDVR